MFTVVSRGLVVQFQDVDALVGMALASIARKMLEFPALDLSPFDRFGLTPLDDAIRHGHVPVQKLLGIRLGIWASVGRCTRLHKHHKSLQANHSSQHRHFTRTCCYDVR